MSALCFRVTGDVRHLWAQKVGYICLVEKTGTGASEGMALLEMPSSLQSESALCAVLLVCCQP